MSPDIEELRKTLITQIQEMRTNSGYKFESDQFQTMAKFISAIVNISEKAKQEALKGLLTTAKGDTQCPFIRCIMEMDDVSADPSKYVLRQQMLQTFGELANLVLTKHTRALWLGGFLNLVKNLKNQCDESLISIQSHIDSQPSSHIQYGGGGGVKESQMDNNTPAEQGPPQYGTAEMILKAMEERYPIANEVDLDSSDNNNDNGVDPNALKTLTV